MENLINCFLVNPLPAVRGPLVFFQRPSTPDGKFARLLSDDEQLLANPVKEELSLGLIGNASGRVRCEVRAQNIPRVQSLSRLSRQNRGSSRPALGDEYRFVVNDFGCTDLL